MQCLVKQHDAPTRCQSIVAVLVALVVVLNVMSKGSPVGLGCPWTCRLRAGMGDFMRPSS